ncbi:hypothetical protein D3C81_1355420 [compost metagenome]
MALEQAIDARQAQRQQAPRLVQRQRQVRRPLPGNRQAWVVSGQQLAQNIVARAPHLRHLHQCRADQVGDHNHLQRIGLLDQRQAQLLGARQYRWRDALDKSTPGENDHARDAHGLAVLHQAQQVGLAARVIDARDEHQLAAHHPLGDAFVLRYVWPAHPPLQVARASTNGHVLQAGQVEDFIQRQAHGSTPASPARRRRPFSSSMRM